MPRLAALDARIVRGRQIERGDRRAGQTVDGGWRMILEQAVPPAAQFIGFDERDRLGEQQRGKILQRPARVILVSPARREVGLIGGERQFEGGRLTRILDFAAALSKYARDVDGLRVVQDLFAIGGITVVGDADLLQPLLAAAVGGDDRPGPRAFVAAVAERQAGPETGAIGFLLDRQLEASGRRLEIDLRGLDMVWCPASVRNSGSLVAASASLAQAIFTGEHPRTQAIRRFASAC